MNIDASKNSFMPKDYKDVTDDILKMKESLMSSLSVGIWTVEFTKVNGTFSAMDCTLDPKHIPMKISVETVETSEVIPKTRNIAEHLLHVYAVDRIGWRSFVIGNTIKFYKKIED